MSLDSPVKLGFLWIPFLNHSGRGGALKKKDKNKATRKRTWEHILPDSFGKTPHLRGSGSRVMETLLVPVPMVLRFHS